MSKEKLFNIKATRKSTGEETVNGPFPESIATPWVERSNKEYPHMEYELVAHAS